MPNVNKQENMNKCKHIEENVTSSVHNGPYHEI